MHSIRQDIEEFRALLEKGSIQNAYGALLSYMRALRTHFKNNLGNRLEPFGLMTHPYAFHDGVKPQSK